MLYIFFEAVVGGRSLCLSIKSPIMEGDSEEPEEEIPDGGRCCWRFIGRQHKLPDCRCGGCGLGRNSLSDHLLPQGHVITPFWLFSLCSLILLLDLFLNIYFWAWSISDVLNATVLDLCGKQEQLWGQMRQGRTRLKLSVLVAMDLANWTRLTSECFHFTPFSAM